MISVVASAPPVALTPEDQAICSGAWVRPYSGVSCAETDAACVRAGVIYKMRKGDRADFAKILAGVDEPFADAHARMFVRAFM